MFEVNCGNGIGAANACRELAKRGFKPDLVIGHAGWGELLFIKDVWPDVPLIGCFEWYFIPKGGPVAFDPEFPERADVASLLHARNGVHHLTHIRCDAGHCATQFQRNAFPDILKPKIEVLHEGIRTDRLLPDHDSEITVARADPPFRRWPGDRHLHRPQPRAGARLPHLHARDARSSQPAPECARRHHRR